MKTPRLPPGMAFGSIDLAGHTWRIVLHTRGAMRGDVYVYVPHEHPLPVARAGGVAVLPARPVVSDDTLFTRARFDPDAAALVFDTGPPLPTLFGPRWDEATMRAPLEVALAALWASVPPPPADRRLPPVAAAVRATDALARLAAGEPEARAELIALARAQVPPAAVRDDLFEPILDAVARWADAPDRDAAGAALCDAFRPLFNELVDKLMDGGLDDPRGALDRLAADPARRAALTHLIALRTDGGLLPALAGCAPDLVTALGLDPAMLPTVDQAIAQIAGSHRAGLTSGRLAASPSQGMLAAPPVFARPAACAADGVAPMRIADLHFEPRDYLDAPLREELLRAVTAGDVNAAAERSIMLLGCDLPTLRADCLRAACEPDAARRAELALALGERLAHAGGLDAGPNMIDVEDVASGRVTTTVGPLR